MFKRFLLIAALLFLCQCSDKEVLLPVVEEGGIAEIENHSSIWIFYDPSEQESKAVLNKNNKLLNTNWIFNIDRRLTMKDVIPQLQNMQADRNKDSMHKKEGMVNYFSYADSKNERISLVKFPEINFLLMDNTGESNTVELDTTRCLVKVHVYEDRLQADGHSFERTGLNDIHSKLGVCKDGKTEVIQLIYDEELSFQSYLETKVFLASSRVMLDTNELVKTLK